MNKQQPLSGSVRAGCSVVFWSQDGHTGRKHEYNWPPPVVDRHEPDLLAYIRAEGNFQMDEEIRAFSCSCHDKRKVH